MKLAVGQARDAITGEAQVGHSVIIADWRRDWVGLGMAEKLAREGSTVRLAVVGPMAGDDSIHGTRPVDWRAA